MSEKLSAVSLGMVTMIRTPPALGWQGQKVFGVFGKESFTIGKINNMSFFRRWLPEAVLQAV